MSDAPASGTKLWDEPRWYVRSQKTGAVVGPVSLDQLARGLEAGKLGSEAQAHVRDGDPWQTVEDVVRVARQADHMPNWSEDDEDGSRRTVPTAVQSPKGRREAQKRRAPTVVLPPKKDQHVVASSDKYGMLMLGLVLVVMLAGVVWAARQQAGAPGAWRSSVVQRAPAGIELVVDQRLGQSATGRVSHWQAASQLAAALCGSTDVASLLRVAARRDLASNLADDDFVQFARQDTWRDGLACGAAFAKSMSDASTLRIQWRNDEKGHAKLGVLAWRGEASGLPSLVRGQPHRFGGYDGGCQLVDSTKSCAPGVAWMRDGSTWVLGTASSVASFATSYARTTGPRFSSSAIAKRLLDSTGYARDYRAVQPWPSAVPWAAPCAFVAPAGDAGTFSSACLSKHQRDAFGRLSGFIRGYGVERWEAPKSRGIYWRYTLLARSEPDAERIASEVRWLMRDWAADLFNRTSVLIDGVPGGRMSQAGAMLPALVRGINGVSVNRSAETVWVTIRMELSSDERALMRQVQRKEHQLQDHIDGFLRAVVDSAPEAIARDHLQNVLGEELATWVLAPKATGKTCDELRRHFMKTFSVPESSRQACAAHYLVRRWRKGVCQGSMMPPEVRTCLLSAPNETAVLACDVPDSPMTKLLRKRLLGRWVLVGVVDREGNRPSRYERRSPRGFMVVIDADKLAYIEPPKEAIVVNLRAWSDRLGAGYVKVPVGGMSPAPFWRVSADKDDRLVLHGYEGGLRLVLRRMDSGTDKTTSQVPQIKVPLGGKRCGHTL